MAIPRIPNKSSIVKTVMDAQENAKARRLMAEDAVIARNVYAAFLRYCNKHGFKNPVLYMDGGAVANSYKYGAESTHLEMRLGDPEKHEPAVVVEALRGWARKKPYGGYGMLRLKMDKPTDGRKWTQMPPFRFDGKSYTFNNSGYMYL